MTRSTVKKWLSSVFAFVMAFVLVFALAACKPDDEKPGPGPEPGEVHVYDGAFIGAAADKTWRLKLKEDGTYYNQHAFSQTAGTWKLLDEEMEYNSAVKLPEGVDEDQENPVYKTATQVIELSEYGGKTMKYAYAEDKIWGVEMDWGMSHKNLTHDPDYEWNEADETPVVVEQFYLLKDSSQSVALNHDGSFQDSINSISGTWTVSDGVYTLTARSGDTYTLTPSEDGTSAEYSSAEETITLYETSINSTYSFNGTVSATLKGETEVQNFEFRLSLYENGDADMAFYDADAYLTAVETGKFTFENDVFAFDFADDVNDNDNVAAAGGIYSYTYTDAKGIFEQADGKAVTVTLTYEQPPVYTMTAQPADGEDFIASAEVVAGMAPIGVTALELRVFATGKAAVWATVDLGDLGAMVGVTEAYETVLEEGTYTAAGNVMTISFESGAVVETQIDLGNETVTGVYQNSVDAGTWLGLPLPGAATFAFDVTFQMDYEPAEVYTFTASDVTAANAEIYTSFAPESIELVCLDNNTYNIVVTIAGQANTVETGSWKMNDDKTIAFTRKGESGVSFASILSGITATVNYSGTMKVNDTIDYGNVTASFICRSAAFNSKTATLAGDKGSAENFGTASIVYGMFTMTIGETSLDLYADGTAVLNATVSISMPGFESVPGGTLDTATYTVEGDTYTFVFEHAGTITGTVADGVLTLEYAGDATYAAPPELAPTLAAGGAATVDFPDMSFTLSGAVTE